jgi:isopenicillin-N N-acyltransferase like protein
LTDSTMEQPDLISVRGSYRSMGADYGRAARDKIEHNLDFYRRVWTERAGISAEDVLAWGDVFAEQVRAYDADIAELIDGVAEGAGFDRRLLFALNAKLELMYGSGYTDCACTSLAVLDSRTTNRHTLLAQNWDWHPDIGPNTVLLSTTDEDGFRVLTLTEAGQVGKSGLNSNGIGVCANLLVTDRDAAGPGVPYAVLLRGVLQSRTMADAISAVTTPTRISSGNFLIAARGGEAIDIEAAPGDFGHLVPRNGLVAHANHFETEVAGRDAKKGSARLTLIRAERVRHLLEDRLDARRVDADAIHEVLTDHFSYPDGLCRHTNPANDYVERIVSAYSMIMDLDELTMDVTPYPVCENPSTTYALDASGVVTARAQRQGTA